MIALAGFFRFEKVSPVDGVWDVTDWRWMLQCALITETSGTTSIRPLGTGGVGAAAEKPRNWWTAAGSLIVGSTARKAALPGAATRRITSILVSNFFLI